MPDSRSELSSKKVNSMPIIGYCLRFMKSFLKLPNQREDIATLRSKINNIETSLDERYKETLLLTNHVNKTLQNIDKNYVNVDGRLSDLSHRVTVLGKDQPSRKNRHPETKTVLADNHLLDKFYIEFENRFRGTEEEIYKRQAYYLKYLLPYKTSSKKQPVLDIGCGRGEFLKLAKDNEINAIGLDLNSAMAEKVRIKGFEVVEKDALSYLVEQPNESLSVITGFHIVEHIPFDELLAILSECYRTLIPGGMMILETPNPENVLIGSWKFYYDPSHLKPLPPELLAFAVESSGFNQIDILRLHPEKHIDSSNITSETNQRIHQHLFGPQDYSVVAKKIK